MTRRLDAVTWLLLSIGVVLRLWQFVGGASLYLDEVSVARSIADRSFAQLLAPLDYGQVAPPAWLLVERLLWSVFGTDWSLRVVAFVAAVASLFLFRALARRTLSGVAIPLAVGAFALGVPFILYGAQVKQYASDVACALALQLLALRLVDASVGDRRRELSAALVGVLAVWFSSGAGIVVVGAGAALVLLAARGELPESRRVLLRVVVPWAGAALAAALVSRALVSPQTMRYMRMTWASAFAPLPPFEPRDLWWPIERLHLMVASPGGLGYVAPLLYSALAVAGAIVLWRAHRFRALILAGPIAVTMALAALQAYPFADRLVLFLTPVVILAMSAAAGLAAERLSVRSRVAGMAAIMVVAAAPLARIIVHRPVYRTQEVRPMLDWMSSRRRPGDAVFVWYRLTPNVLWYAPLVRLPLTEVVWGDCWLEEPRRFLRDLDPLRGRPRVWVLTAGGGSRETRLLFAYADSVGRRLEGKRFNATLPGYLPVEAALYDLSDATRLARFDATTFPVTIEPQPPQAILACSAGPMAVRPPRVALGGSGNGTPPER